MVISVVGQRINCLNFGSRLHVDPNLQQRMQASFLLVVVLIHKDKTTLCFEHDKTDMFGTHPMKLLNKGFSWIVGAFLSTFQWTKMEVVVSSKTLPLKPPGDADPAVTVAAAVAAAKSASPRHEWLWRKETAMDGSWCVSRGCCDVRRIFQWKSRI